MSRNAKEPSAVVAILFVLTGYSFSQDWAVSLWDSSAKNQTGSDLLVRVGRLSTSESQLTNGQQRLLRTTRYQRIPVGIYGWGAQATLKSSNFSAVLDVTSGREKSAKNNFRGLDAGARIQYQFEGGWFFGGNLTYDFDDKEYFAASDFGYRSDDWDVRIVGYTTGQDISGGFVFAQYRLTDWLQLDAGLDYQSDRDEFDKLFGVRFFFVKEHVDFTIDYIHEGKLDRGDTIRGRVRWQF